MDSHLESIPGLGSFTTGCLSGRDLECLGWETDGALNAEILALSTLDEFLADFLEGLDFAGGQGDADLVSFLEKDKCQNQFVGRGVRVERTGPSPNSFSGFW